MTNWALWVFHIASRRSAGDERKVLLICLQRNELCLCASWRRAGLASFPAWSLTFSRHTTVLGRALTYSASLLYAVVDLCKNIWVAVVLGITSTRLFFCPYIHCGACFPRWRSKLPIIPLGVRRGGFKDKRAALSKIQETSEGCPSCSHRKYSSKQKTLSDVNVCKKLPVAL